MDVEQTQIIADAEQHRSFVGIVGGPDQVLRRQPHHGVLQEDGTELVLGPTPAGAHRDFQSVRLGADHGGELFLELPEFRNGLPGRHGVVLPARSGQGPHGFPVCRRHQWRQFEVQPHLELTRTEVESQTAVFVEAQVRYGPFGQLLHADSPFLGQPLQNNPCLLPKLTVPGIPGDFHQFQERNLAAYPGQDLHSREYTIPTGTLPEFLDQDGHQAGVNLSAHALPGQDPLVSLDLAGPPLLQQIRQKSGETGPGETPGRVLVLVNHQVSHHVPDLVDGDGPSGACQHQAWRPDRVEPLRNVRQIAMRAEGQFGSGLVNARFRGQQPIDEVGVGAGVAERLHPVGVAPGEDLEQVRGALPTSGVQPQEGFEGVQRPAPSAGEEHHVRLRVVEMPQQCVPRCAAAEARDQPGSRRRPRSMGELRFKLGQCSVAVPGHETRQGGATAWSRFQQRLVEFSGCIGGAERGPEPFLHLRNPGEHPGHPGHGDRGAVGSGIESGHVRESRGAHRQNRFERFPTP